MFGGTGSDDGVWGFAALAQGVKGLGLEAEQVEVQAQNFGAWRRKPSEVPDSPEEKQAVAFHQTQEKKGLLPKPLVQLQDVVCSIGETSAAEGLVFSPIAVSSPNPRARRSSARELGCGGVIRPPNRQLTKALRGSYFGFSSDNKRPVRRSLDSSLGVVVVPDPDPSSQQIDFKAELISLLDNQIREKLDALECPVCLSPASAPIYACPESHIICSNCLPRLSLCGVCRVDLRSVTAGQSLVKRHRYAEKMEEEVKKLKDKKRGLGIDQDLGVGGQTCSVEDEDLVLEHKTIKKMNVDCEISRIQAHGQ